VLFAFLIKCGVFRGDSAAGLSGSGVMVGWVSFLVYDTWLSRRTEGNFFERGGGMIS